MTAPATACESPTYGAAPAAPWTPRPLAELEQQHITLALQHYGHNIRQAALALGIDPSTLHRKLKRQGLSSVG